MNRLRKLVDVHWCDADTAQRHLSQAPPRAYSVWLMRGALSFFTSLVLMASVSASATNEAWKLLGRTTDGQVYVDLLSAVTDDKGITHAQVRIDYASPTEIGRLLLIGQQNQVRLSCVEKQSATDSISVTQQDGKRFIMASYEAAPFEEIPAGSATALLMSELCSRAM